ncbi:MAG TPA: hypothetical protein VID93_02550, partial [Acidimicrobiales bacterium]
MRWRPTVALVIGTVVALVGCRGGGSAAPDSPAPDSAVSDSPAPDSAVPQSSGPATSAAVVP